MNRLDETQKDATGKGLSDSGYKTESNANGSSDVIEADYEEICKALAPSISPNEYRKVTKNIDAQTVEKDLFLQRILLNEALLPLRIVLPEGLSKTGLLLKNFKELTQKHPAVIAFYLPCLEIYRHRSERSKFRDLLNEAKTNCAGIIGIQRACERIDARYFSKSTIISLNAESTINSLRAYTTDARSDVRRSVFTSARHLTQPSTESEGSNPIKIRKTEVENSLINYEGISKIARPPSATSRFPKLEKEKEIEELTNLVEHFCLTESKMQELKAKLGTCDMNVFREGAKTLQIVFKESEKPLHLSDQELSGLIQPLTKNGLALALNNIQQGNLRATQHVTVLCCNILHKILKQKHNCDRISAEDLRSVGLFLFSILKNESAQEINQSVDNKFTSVLVQLISDVNKHCKHAIVALMYLSLISDSLREEKLIQIDSISNFFFKFFSTRNAKENLSENDISQIYFSTESFLKEFPKSREVFKKSPLYFNALRTVVTFATNLTRFHTEAVERFIVNSTPKKSNLLDLIKKEIMKQKAKASEEESLLNTFKKTLTKVKKVSSHDVGLEELHQFVIANPEFDLDAELSKEDEKFQNYIKNKLGNKKAGHEMTMISSIPPTASAIEQRARAMSKEYSLTSTPSKALSKISRVANEKENVSAAPADTRALPSKSTLEEYRKRLEQLRNARK